MENINKIIKLIIVLILISSLSSCILIRHKNVNLEPKSELEKEDEIRLPIKSFDWQIFEEKKISNELTNMFKDSDVTNYILNRSIFFELYCDSKGNIDSVLFTDDIKIESSLIDKIVTVIKNQEKVRVLKFPCNGVYQTILEYDIRIKYIGYKTIINSDSLNRPCE